ncbi:OLC1v1008807C1 [Oldenlandia corymbosa var. corymbosa]|uniref:OLC1v1008807C1 n=1 Tax=Oldenlandia corymbosa var. corymbosa TaxID=529605 RepID=A0AAV1DQN2_OLDCO|nr:OLC1v1008807C1 [Oldenlandia corymbosa var. corymbosa]
MPYSPATLVEIDPSCSPGFAIWMSQTWLLYFGIREPHIPGRVLRQFGFLQQLPDNTFIMEKKEIEKLHKETRGKKCRDDVLQRWETRHNTLAGLQTDMTLEPQAAPEYLVWYQNRTVTLVTNPSDYRQSHDFQGSAESLHIMEDDQDHEDNRDQEHDDESTNDSDYDEHSSHDHDEGADQAQQIKSCPSLLAHCPPQPSRKKSKGELQIKVSRQHWGVIIRRASGHVPLTQIMVRDSEGKTVLDFVSTIDSMDKVEYLRSKYDFPSALQARAPLGNERANSPPRGRITVYDRFIHLGLRFPLYPLFEEIVQYYRTPLARFTPNLITFVLEFARVCQYVKVVPRLILWRYFFQVVVASTSFQDWYIVKRRLRAGVKKMVEAYGGSPEWKSDFVFVKVPASYCLPWNLRETKGLGAIKDEWTQEDEECVEEFQADVEKILKCANVVKWNDVQYYVPPAYVKEGDMVMSSSNVGSRLFGDEDPFVIVNSNEDVTITAAPQKKKKKRIVKVGDRSKPKKAKMDVPPKETAQPSVETVPVTTESMQKTVPETGPSRVPPEMSAASMGYLVQLRKLREDLVAARAERDEALFEVVTLEEKVRQVQAKEAEIVEVLAKYDELDEKMKSFAGLHISKEELHQWCTAFMYRMMSTGGMAAALEEVNLVATKCGAHRVGVAGLRMLDQDRPIKAKWFKQLLMKDSKKTMYEAMVKVLTRLSLEQLPLWGALTCAMPKMSSPTEIASFPGDVPAVLAKGPSEEDPIPEVPDEYVDIELEDADEETEEDVADTDHSGVQRNAEDASQAPSKDPSNDPSNDPLPGSDAV